MTRNTDHLALLLDDAEEFYDIGKVNENLEKIDAGYHEIDEKIRGLTAENIKAEDNFQLIGPDKKSNVQKLIDIIAEKIKNELITETELKDTYALKSTYGDTVVSMGRKQGTVVGSKSFAFGSSVEASGNCSHAEGNNTIASNYYSHAEGYNTAASGDSSHAEGSAAKASGLYSHAEGDCATASGRGSHAEGYFTKASGQDSHAEGYITKAGNFASHSCGKLNKDMVSGGGSNTQIGDAFAIGNGTAMNACSNALRVTYTGDILATKAFASSGADYAEFIKPWHDDNVDNEDRVGYFVTVKEGKLYKANTDDYIFGITSGNPSVVGNNDEDYYWKYERDEFNRIVMEDVPEEIQVKNKDGNFLFDEKTQEPVMMKTGKIIKNARMKLSDDYDPSLQKSYQERKYRKEWDYVGIVGVVPVRDDGTCIPGCFCKCGDDGVATFADKFTFNTYMVIERISDNVINVFLK